MNASLPAVLLVLLLSTTWLLGRRRTRPFLRSTDTAAVVALNRAQIERLRERPLEAPATAELHSPAVPSPTDVRSQAATSLHPLRPAPAQQRLRQLQLWLAGSREQRLRAIAEAVRIQHRCVLPLLRRGLRDPDPAVMAAAAAAMERYRGRTAAASVGSPLQPRSGRLQAGRGVAGPRPLSVSRTR
jgi:hypothetical protein